VNGELSSLLMSRQSAGNTAGQHLDEIGPALKITDHLRPQAKETPSGLVSSGGVTLVAMMQSTDLRVCDDSASIRRLHTARFRAVLLQCQMCPAAMVPIKEHFELPDKQRSLNTIM
jgi:hypothetical protein